MQTFLTINVTNHFSITESFPNSAWFKYQASISQLAMACGLILESGDQECQQIEQITGLL